MERFESELKGDDMRRDYFRIDGGWANGEQIMATLILPTAFLQPNVTAIGFKLAAQLAGYFFPVTYHAVALKPLAVLDLDNIGVG